VYGTDIADDLRSRNFAGVVLIRSANASQTDRTAYMRSGAVDGCIGKDDSHVKVVESVRHVFHTAQRTHKRARSPSPNESESQEPGMRKYRKGESGGSAERLSDSPYPGHSEVAGSS